MVHCARYDTLLYVCDVMWQAAVGIWCRPISRSSARGFVPRAKARPMRRGFAVRNGQFVLERLSLHQSATASGVHQFAHKRVHIYSEYLYRYANRANYYVCGLSARNGF